MATNCSVQSRSSRNSQRRRRSKNRQTLQKPNGTIAPRVKAVGAESFAVVCVDPAKMRSEMMMADYMGNVFVQPMTVEHQPAALEAVVHLVKDQIEKHRIKDLIVTIERTGNYHRVTQKVFARAGFDVRLVHPFATKQYRLPADAGNKTDATDLFAQHRAAIAGFGLCEFALPEVYEQLRLRVRHRRDLVEKSTTIACQIREHLHLSMPYYANMFHNFFAHQAAIAVARKANSAQAILEMNCKGLNDYLTEQKIRFQKSTLEKILAWAQQAAKLEQVESQPLHHAIWSDLHDLYQSIEQTIVRLEAEIAGNLVQTPYIRLLAIPGINVVSAADLAGEMGPIAHYANANAITGRSGLFPSRYQSDQTDHPGTIVRTANRRLRAALMRIADNLANLNQHFRLVAASDEILKINKRATRVKIAKRFSRIAFACVAGDAPLKHDCCRNGNSILVKLRLFHYEHETAIDRTLLDLENAVAQLPLKTRGCEAELVAQSLEQVSRRRGPKRLGELLTSILARLTTESTLTNEEQTASD
jgi:transposase